MKKSLLILVIIVVVLSGGFYFYDRNYKKAQAPDNGQSGIRSNNSQNPSTSTAASSKPQDQAPIKSGTGQSNASGHYSNGDEADGESVIQVVEVDYDGNKFSPIAVNINVNDYVFFKNTGTAGFLPVAVAAAGGQAYPGLGAGASILPGKSYKFQFTKTGKWSVTEKNNSSAIVMVNVK